MHGSYTDGGGRVPYSSHFAAPTASHRVSSVRRDATAERRWGGHSANPTGPHIPTLTVTSRGARQPWPEAFNHPPSLAALTELDLDPRPAHSEDQRGESRGRGIRPSLTPPGPEGRHRPNGWVSDGLTSVSQGWLLANQDWGGWVRAAADRTRCNCTRGWRMGASSPPPPPPRRRVCSPWLTSSNASPARSARSARRGDRRCFRIPHVRYTILWMEGSIRTTLCLATSVLGACECVAYCASARTTLSLSSSLMAIERGPLYIPVYPDLAP